MSKVVSIGVVAALFLVAGCATYAPSSTNSSTGGQPAVAYAVPSSQPRGQVRLSTPGVTHAPGGTRAIYLRMVVSNDSHQTWQLDPQRQAVGFAGATETRPIVVTAARGSALLPVSEQQPIAIAPGRSQIVDLYFPLPAGYHASKLPPFEAAWVVNAGDRTIAGTTHFRRVAPDALLPCGARQRCVATSAL